MKKNVMIVLTPWSSLLENLVFSWLVKKLASFLNLKGNYCVYMRLLIVFIMK
jgi:hypothetical protein